MIPELPVQIPTEQVQEDGERIDGEFTESHRGRPELERGTLRPAWPYPEGYGRYPEEV